MTRQFKKHIIKAEDVKASSVYMANNRPCLIKCEAEPGWKRGYVSITGKGNRFYAWAMYFDGKYGLIELHSTEKDFYFCDVTGHATLKQLPETWLAEQRAAISHARNELDKVEQMLNSIVLYRNSMIELQTIQSADNFIGGLQENTF